MKFRNTRVVVLRSFKSRSGSRFIGDHLYEQRPNPLTSARKIYKPSSKTSSSRFYVANHSSFPLSIFELRVTSSVRFLETIAPTFVHLQHLSTRAFYESSRTYRSKVLFTGAKEVSRNGKEVLSLRDFRFINNPDSQS